MKVLDLEPGTVGRQHRGQVDGDALGQIRQGPGARLKKRREIVAAEPRRSGERRRSRVDLARPGERRSRQGRRTRRRERRIEPPLRVEHDPRRPAAGNRQHGQAELAQKPDRVGCFDEQARLRAAGRRVDLPRQAGLPRTSVQRQIGEAEGAPRRQVGTGAPDEVERRQRTRPRGKEIRRQARRELRQERAGRVETRRVDMSVERHVHAVRRAARRQAAAVDAVDGEIAETQHVAGLDEIEAKPAGFDGRLALTVDTHTARGETDFEIDVAQSRAQGGHVGHGAQIERRGLHIREEAGALATDRAGEGDRAAQRRPVETQSEIPPGKPDGREIDLPRSHYRLERERRAIRRKDRGCPGGQPIEVRHGRLGLAVEGCRGSRLERAVEFETAAPRHARVDAHERRPVGFEVEAERDVIQGLPAEQQRVARPGQIERRTGRRRNCPGQKLPQRVGHVLERWGLAFAGENAVEVDLARAQFRREPRRRAEQQLRGTLRGHVVFVVAQPHVDGIALGMAHVAVPCARRTPACFGGAEAERTGQGDGPRIGRPAVAEGECALGVDARQPGTLADDELEAHLAALDRTGRHTKRRPCAGKREGSVGLEGPTQRIRLRVEIDAGERQRARRLRIADRHLAAVDDEPLEAEIAGERGCARRTSERSVRRERDREPRRLQMCFDEVDVAAQQGEKGEFSLHGGGRQDERSRRIARLDPIKREIRRRQQPQIDAAADVDGRAGNIRQPRLDDRALLGPIDEIGTDQSRRQQQDEQSGGDGQTFTHNGWSSAGGDGPPWTGR